MFTTVIAIAVLLAGGVAPQTRQSVRIAAFNIWQLSTTKLDQVDSGGHGTNAQLRNAAEIIQRVRPDILFVNEIDFDAARCNNAAAFRDRYLKISQNGQPPLDYPHVFFAPVNTGVPTEFDLDRDGRLRGPGDAMGFGHYPGQYGMVLYSKYPIDTAAARTFQKLLWKDMPNNLLPDGQAGKPEWYVPPEVAVLRLSSKSHWDVPVKIGEAVVHLLACHPTPPVFDGREDRNGRRNFDEVRLWADYLTGGAAAEYLVDDQGQRGGLSSDRLFVILGDLNAEPAKGEQTYGCRAIDQLLKHPRVQDPAPQSKGAAADAQDYPGEKACRTSGFGRVDYVLPCRELQVKDAGVFWPPPDDPSHKLIQKRETSSDHRLVWVDVVIPAKR
ncbi:MAG: endonuclease/exonuclease/phosphatase family protein [Planctomycetes bacterium]|nr:endonuclease/exonuclease/phosphatase family protein [Planctomycetota bacterium]